MVDLAVECGLRGEAGVIGHDEDRGGRLRAIEFDRIKGGKPFDVTEAWFKQLLADIGQPEGEVLSVRRSAETPSIPAPTAVYR